MSVFRTSFIACLACFLVSTEVAQADCCAGHRSDYYVSLSVRVGPSRATPFAGTINPRYANPGYAATRSIGGPVATAGPTDFLVRQAALEQAARYEYEQSLQAPVLHSPVTQYASDVELMDQPASEESDSDEEPEQEWSPAYPGQQAPRHIAAQDSPRRVATKQVTTTKAAEPRRRTVSSRPATKSVGAYSSPAAMRLANSLQKAGLGG
ncbi:hypothetical protein [Aeoliella sp.]|uniref:hypothetical protein n=1 Tax=Aeoliella sp. TaxID=2795800 RepID=UPI003CCBC685